MGSRVATASPASRAKASTTEGSTIVSTNTVVAPDAAAASRTSRIRAGLGSASGSRPDSPTWVSP